MKHFISGNLFKVSELWLSPMSVRLLYMTFDLIETVDELKELNWFRTFEKIQRRNGAVLEVW